MVESSGEVTKVWSLEFGVPKVYLMLVAVTGCGAKIPAPSFPRTRESRAFETFYGRIKNDGLVKNLKGRHSRKSGSPEVLEFPGFPLSRE